MHIFVDHIGYIGITLLAGMALGWKTYPLYQRFIKHIRGQHVQPVRVRNRDERRR